MLRPHPAREQILDLMRRHGAPISPVQLARITGVTLSATAYHVRTLLAAGLIERAGEKRGVRGAVEHFYKVIEEDAASPDTVRLLLGLCGALTVRHADGGGYPVPTELDDDARTELEGRLDRLCPWVQQIAAASTARVRRKRS